VALSDDGSSALIGAPDTNFAKGAAYVFTRSNASWSGPAQLTTPDGSSNFGASVALSEDGSTALVGAPGTNAETGAAYVYTLSSGTWSNPTALTTPSVTAEFGFDFGSSVALSGDGATALVGTLYINMAYLYSRSNGSWSGPTALSGPSGSDGFGRSVALSGDGTTALVGAPNSGFDGAAYVYTRSNGGWSGPTALSLPSGTFEIGFGSSVALSRDGATALVGAPSGSYVVGPVYVYKRSNASWSGPVALGVPPTVSITSNFGNAVALSADGATALVGASFFIDPTGGAYVYRLSNGSWSSPLPVSVPSRSGGFGTSVALSDDGSTVLVGANEAAYVFVSQQHATSTGARCTPNQVTAGSPTTCTATVTDTTGGTASTPGGMVSFGTTGSGVFGTGGSCTLAPTATTGAATCAVTYTATRAGTDTITAAYRGDDAHATSSGTTHVTIIPGPPAALAISPAGQTQTVNAQACLQATEADRFGNAVPNSPVLFAVSGVNRAAGSQSTNAGGQATFCYTGPLAGSDTVTAVADPNHMGQPQPGEPRGTAGVTWTLPASTPWCSVLMRGTITAADGDSAIFAGLGTLQATGAPRGYVRYGDPGLAQRLSISAPVQALVCNSAHTQADLYGTTPINGDGSYAYRVEVVVGPTGAATYSLLLSSGYSSGAQVVRNGAVRISARLA
jgi:hypothetical protein